ncbi:MAG TPA: hypothetical protein PLP57_10230 [Candidatus Saccharicenans sp.]|nr:hypothetical protein [Candidatus Saccharicenans sp.]
MRVEVSVEVWAEVRDKKVGAFLADGSDVSLDSGIKETEKKLIRRIEAKASWKDRGLTFGRGGFRCSHRFAS